MAISSHLRYCFDRVLITDDFLNRTKVKEMLVHVLDRETNNDEVLKALKLEWLLIMEAIMKNSDSFRYMLQPENIP